MEKKKNEITIRDNFYLRIQGIVKKFMKIIMIVQAMNY